MLPILEGHRARWAAAESVVAVIALGPALVAVGDPRAHRRPRRAPAARPRWRSRGAAARPGAQVIVPVVVEGLLIALPAAVARRGRRRSSSCRRAASTSTIAAVASVVAVAVVVMVATIARGRARAGTGADAGGARIVADAGPGG